MKFIAHVLSLGVIGPSDVFVGLGNLLTNSVHLPRLRNDQATSYDLVAMFS